VAPLPTRRARPGYSEGGSPSPATRARRAAACRPARGDRPSSPSSPQSKCSSDRLAEAFAPPNVQAASAALSVGHDRPLGGSWQVPPRRAATRRGAYAIDLAALAAVIGERVRDKIAASKRKGLWVGGPVPLGYAAVDKKILVVPAEAAAVRTILPVIDRRGIRSKPRRRSSAGRP
jgi:hypothetical protein